MPWLVVIGLVLVWQLSVMVFDIPNFLLPSPAEIYLELQRNWYLILPHAALTIFTTMIGLAIGIIVGLILGILLGSIPLVYSGLYPVLVGFNSIPKVALVPILVLWLGIGQPTAIATAFLLCFFPIAVNVAAGLATVEPEVEDVLRSLGASKMDLIVKIGLPRSMPYFFASLKVAITLAFIGTIIAETIASNSGIGYLIIQASSRFRVALMFAGVTVIACMSILTYVFFSILERRMVGWAFRSKS